MERASQPSKVRRQFGKLLQEYVSCSVRGDRFLVERHGEPVAAVVPIAVYDQWKRARGDFFAKIHAAATRSDVPATEAEHLASQAVDVVRRDGA